MIYSSKIKQSKKLSVPVVVIGNITVGGTGKTPFVDFTLGILKSKGINVGVISRGYGGNYTGVTNVDLNISNAAIAFGDEPTLLKSKNPETPIYLSANRFKSGRLLLSENKNIQGIVCDDGFQHFSLERDFNIVLIDCTEDLNNYKMLPHGRLREPLKGLDRADFIIFTKSNWVSKTEIKKAKELIGNYYPLNEGNHAVAAYNSDFPEVDKNNILLVSSIARPSTFEESVRKSNLYNIKGHMIFKDHHCYSSKDIRNIIQELNYNKCDLILTTEKDLVKLNQFDKIKPKLKTVNINVALTSGKESFERELFKIFN